MFKAKTVQDELAEALEGTRRENKSLAQEIKDLTDQLGEGGRSVHELQKIVRRLEVEKEEIQHALDEAEAALEAEESKVLRAQVEVSQIRSEIEKRIQEKEEEFENTRKNHQRALESMQATLEAETKGKQEALRIKKKLESDINVIIFLFVCYFLLYVFRNLKLLLITLTKLMLMHKKLLKNTKIKFASFNFKLKMNNVNVMN